MLATVENMRRYAEIQPRPFAYSIATEERYSADAGDYFWLPDGEPLTDENDEPMVLAQEIRTIELLGA